MASRLYRSCHAHDPGSWIFLRRTGPQKERPGYDHAQFFHPGAYQYPMGSMGI